LNPPVINTHSPESYEPVFQIVREVAASDRLLQPGECAHQYFRCESFGKISWGLGVYVTTEDKEIVIVELSESSIGPSSTGKALLNNIAGKLKQYYDENAIEFVNFKINGEVIKINANQQIR